MRRTAAQAWCLAWLAALPSGAVCAEGWGGSLGLSSDYVYRGLTLSDNHPAGQLDVHYANALGGGSAYAGLSASSVKRTPHDTTTVELDPYLGYQWRCGDRWSANLSALHHDFPWNNPGRRYNYEEFSGTLGYADRAFLTVAYSPDTAVETRYDFVSGRPALAYDLALRQPLPQALSLVGGVGYYDLRWAVHSGYLYWNAGLAWDLRRLHLELSWIDTDGTARELFYEDQPVRRLVGSALWRF